MIPCSILEKNNIPVRNPSYNPVSPPINQRADLFDDIFLRLLDLNI
jgi:hypothetical protein